MRNKLNILEIALSHAWGGLELQFCKFAEEFQKLGHSVYVISAANPQIEKIINELNLPLFTITPHIKYLDVFAGYKISQIIDKYNIDIIHAHISRNLSTVILGKTISGKGKLVFTNHIDTRRKKKDIFHKWVYSHIAKLITISEDMKKHHTELTAINENKVVRIYNGINLKGFDKNLYDRTSILKKYSLPETKNIIGCIARLTSIKNQELLVRVVPEVVKYFPDTLFLFVGKEDKDKYGRGYQLFLTSLAEELGVLEKIRFTGFVDNIPEITSLFDILVLTTLKESFGLVLIEAMAMEIPAVASRAGGVPEIIDEGLNGRMYEPGSVKDLSGCIIDLLSDENGRLEMGLNARKTVENKFVMERNIKEYEKVFLNLLNE